MRWKGSRPEIARLHVNRQLLLHLPRRRPCNRTTTGPHQSELGGGHGSSLELPAWCVRSSRQEAAGRSQATDGAARVGRRAQTGQQRAPDARRMAASCAGFPGGSTPRGNDQPRRHRPATHSPTNCWFSRRACTTCASLPSPPPPPRPPPPTNIFSLSAPPPANPLRAVGAHLRLSTTETDRRPCSQSGWPSGGQPTRPQPPCLRPNDGCLHVSRGNRVQALGTGGSGSCGSGEETHSHHETRPRPAGTCVSWRPSWPPAREPGGSACCYWTG